MPLRYIGDTILTTPLLTQLHQSLPNAQLDVLTSKTSKSLLSPCPFLNAVIEEPKSLFKLFQQMKAGDYTAVIILRKSVSFALMCQLASIPIRIGYDKQRFFSGYKRFGWFLTHKFTYPTLKTLIPQSASHLQALPILTTALKQDRLERFSQTALPEKTTPLSPSMLRPTLWYTAADAENVIACLKKNNSLLSEKPIAIFHGVSASHGKQIPLDRFLPALQYLIEQGFQVFCTGTEADFKPYQNFIKTHALPLINLAGQTTLREMYYLLKKSNLVLTIDSSPIHLASAADVPYVVGVFGPTNHYQWGIVNLKTDFKPVFLELNCRPCYAKVCSHNQCKLELPAEQILLAVKDCVNKAFINNQLV
ncbi:MAG: glycosyltransferase family 9 protein [Cyanobacteria bacterium P01_H01_bin.74]